MAEQPPVLWLDQDVVDWLHEYAAERYGGDFDRCINVMLRMVMTVHQNPERPWAGINYEAGTKGPGRGFGRSPRPGSTG